MSDELGRLTSADAHSVAVASKSRRPGSISSSHRRQTPYVPPSSRFSAASMRTISDARRSSAARAMAWTWMASIREKTADTLLIEGHRFATVGGLLTEFGQLVPQSAEASPDVAIAGHITTKPSQTGARGRSPGGHRP